MQLNLVSAKLIEIFLKNLGMSEFEISNFIEEHRGNLLDLLFMKILNKYAEKSSKEEIVELEKKMADISKYGRAEDQKFVMNIISDTMKNHPELATEIRTQQNEISTKLFFSLMEKADDKGQEDALSYLMESLTQSFGINSES